MGASVNANANILVIDPDREFCKSVRLYLEESYNVFSRQGLDNIDYAILLKRIDLLLIDADYITENLSEVLSSIHSKHPNLKIIIIYTYFSSNKKEELTIAEEADDLLAKPFDVKVLKEKVDHLIRPAS